MLLLNTDRKSCAENPAAQSGMFYCTATGNGNVAFVWWLKEAIAPTLSYNRVIALSPPTMR